MRAVIDIGTNSTLLLIGTLNKYGKVESVLQRFHVTRLGEGVHINGSLTDPAMDRTLKVLDDYDLEIRQQAQITVHAIGTQALRVAANANEFIARVKDRYDWDLQVISGEEEARFSFLGALDAIDAGKSEVIVMDVGGGSTEIISGLNESISGHQSLPLGVVRAGEKLKMKENLDSADCKTLVDWAESCFQQLAFPVPMIAKLIGVGGTITTLAAIKEAMQTYDPEKINGYILDTDNLWSLFERLNALSIEERRNIPGLVRGREDVIVYGTLLFIAFMDFAGINQIIASDRGLRFGYLKWKELQEHP
jgi:exopolyphosphatase/guanosine-5'-triphosphate,3'-diphosphate pyrophosphatase